MENTPEKQGELTVYESRFPVAETMDRIEKLLAERHIPVYLRFDHTRNALEAGLGLRPTQVILFGSPANGTLLMQQNQQVAIDLPLRFVVWEDERGSVRIGFTEMQRIAQRYGLADNPVIGRTQQILERIAEQAAVR